MVCLWIFSTGGLSPITFTHGSCNSHMHLHRCLIVKTETYTQEQVGRVVQIRANVEGLTLGEGVLEKLATDGEKGSLRYVCFYVQGRSHLFTYNVYLRYALQLLTPASILASLQGRTQIGLEDIGEMNELFLDAKTSAEMMSGS